jgi:hypothetical protein
VGDFDNVGAACIIVGASLRLCESDLAIYSFHALNEIDHD